MVLIRRVLGHPFVCLVAAWLGCVWLLVPALRIAAVVIALALHACDHGWQGSPDPLEVMGEL